MIAIAGVAGYCSYDYCGFAKESAKKRTATKTKKKKASITKAEILKSLIQDGVLQSQEDVKSAAGVKALFDACTKGDDLMIKKLIVVGVNVNTPYEEGKTPLVQAVYYGHVGAVKTLIAAKANVNHVTGNGLNILMHACYGGDRTEIVSILLQAGADPTIRSRWGTNTLEYAKHQHRSQIVELLKKQGMSE